MTNQITLAEETNSTDTEAGAGGVEAPTNTTSEVETPAEGGGEGGDTPPAEGGEAAPAPAPAPAPTPATTTPTTTTIAPLDRPCHCLGDEELLTEGEEAEEQGLGDEVDGVAGPGEVQLPVARLLHQLALLEIDRYR